MTSSRLLKLLALLQARREWTGPELARRLEVSERTIRRDVERLRGLEYPVDSVTGPAGGYALRAGAAMPPLLLDDDEAIAVAVGLATAAHTAVTGIDETALRALVKLEQVLPAHLRRRVRALQAATLTLPAGGPTIDPEHLTVIAAACRDGERLRFTYRGRDAEPGRREVEPHALVNLGRRWYLVAWDCGRRDWRTFRVDRLGRPAPAGRRVPPRALPAADAAAFVAERLAARPSRYEARITLHAPAEAIREGPAARWGTVEPLDGDRCELRTGDDDLDWLAVRIALLDADFEVHEPPELIERLATMGRRLTRAYSPPPLTATPDS